MSATVQRPQNHLLIFIHGMGDGGVNGPYVELLTNMETVANDRFPDTIKVDWSSITQQAEDILLDECFRLRPQPFSPPRIGLDLLAIPDLKVPLLERGIPAIRNFVTGFLGDVVAYVSGDVQVIRCCVWDQIHARLVEDDVPFTLIAHSLGSLIAHDFVYHLFGKGDPDKGRIFVPDGDKAVDAATIKKIQGNFRNLITFGSPIGLFMMQKDDLWHEGANFNKIVNPVRGDRRWLNFYDIQDPIAYPVANLFARNPENDPKVLEDVRVNSGGLLEAHTGYWGSLEMARGIVEVIKTAVTAS